MIRQPKVLLSFIFLGTFALFWASLLSGAYPIDASAVMAMFTAKLVPMERTWTAAQETVLFDVRLPRILLVLLVGAALSVSGAVLQAVFRNPLVSPYLLGISSGASFGASLIVVAFSFANPYVIQLSAFFFGLLAVSLTGAIANLAKEHGNTIIILSGVIVSAFFSALVGLLKYFAEPHELQAIVIWLMGNFTSAEWEHVGQVAPVSIIGCTLMICLSWRVNALSLGTQQAAALGINLWQSRVLLIGLASFMTSVAVSVCGPIGWIGLIIPHLVRILVGPNNAHVILGSVGLGSGFLLVVDLAARSLFPIEIPIGILTAVAGALFFVLLLIKRRRTVWQP